MASFYNPRGFGDPRSCPICFCLGHTNCCDHPLEDVTTDDNHSISELGWNDIWTECYRIHYTWSIRVIVLCGHCLSLKPSWLRRRNVAKLARTLTLQSIGSRDTSYLVLGKLIIHHLNKPQDPTSSSFSDIAKNIHDEVVCNFHLFSFFWFFFRTLTKVRLITLNIAFVIPTTEQFIHVPSLHADLSFVALFNCQS
jgi:hypothetical protein